MEKERKKYPIGAENFTLYEKVGTGASASVYRALCKPHNEIVSIKVLDFERSNTDLANISREAQTMILVDHPNVLKSHCSFITDHSLWVVMPYMAGGSCLHILKLAHQDGFEEVVIATILREVLKGLEYLHENGHIHRDVKAGNILIDSRGGIKLGDFGVSAYLFDGGDRQRMRNTFVGTPCWMAPEVMEQSHGYDFKADIWSFGITALELAHGHAPFSKYPPMKVLLMTLQNAPPGLDYERDKKFSKSFRQMIASCLEKDPSKRPIARKLLKHSFFRKARSNDYIARHLLEGLPALGDRLKAIKKKDEEMLAQKKMPDGEKEEISQNIYKRGISAWDFNLEDIRAQAALDDDSVVEQDDDTPTKQLQHQSSFTMERSSDASEDNAPTSVSSVDSTTNIAKCEKSNGEARIPGSTTEVRTTNMVLGNGNLAANRSVENPASEVNRKSAGSQIGPNKEEKAQNQSQNLSHDGLLILQKSDCAQLEIPSKGSKASANDNEVDEKAKNQVVQQKGRFKVTSENIENEKVVPCPVMPKCHNMQVTAPNPAASLQSPLEATPSSPSGHSVFPLLQSILQSNVLQRDFILGVMKQVSNDSSGCLPMNAAMTQISLVEAANDREKELLIEINDLKRRLGCALEELQKYKKDNARENNT